LDVLNNIVNAGTISSAGSLNLQAGGTIINALPPGVTGQNPVMSAINNVSLQTNTLVNSGTIASINGNVNIATIAGQLAQNININGAGGQMAALNGAINIGNSSLNSPNTLSISGGDYLSQQLNLIAGNGNVNAQLGNVTGVMSTSAGQAHVSSQASTLDLGSTSVAGDPTFYNTGAINISAPVNVAADLTIAAGGSITGTDAITTQNSNGKGNTVNIIAGAAIKATGGALPAGTVPAGPAIVSGSISINGPSSTGGSITLTGGTINVSSTVSNAASGNVNLIAYANGAGTGDVSIGLTDNIIASGSGTGANGNLTVIAGGTNIQLGNTLLNHQAGSGGVAGIVTITAAQPVGTYSFNSNGTATGSAFAASTTLSNAAVTYTSIVTDGGAITIRTGGTVTTGTTNANGLTLGRAGGAINCRQ
jgi:hypothetical protein